MTTKPRLSAYLEGAAKASAIISAFVYALGILIANIHSSRFGISQFELLKPKFFATGVVFIVITAVTVVVPRLIRRQLSRGLDEAARNSSFLSAIVLALTTMAYFWLLPPLFEIFFLIPIEGRRRAPSVMQILVTVVVLGYVFGVVLGRWRHRRAVVERASLLMVILVPILEGLMGNSPRFWIALWLCFAAISYAMVEEALTSDDGDWIGVLVAGFLCVSVLTSYARAIHPLIQPTYGGGAAVPITIYFNERNAAFKGQWLETSLIADDSTGLFVAPAPSVGPDAYFIPRESIAVIHYRPIPPLNISSWSRFPIRFAK